LPLLLRCHSSCTSVVDPFIAPHICIGLILVVAIIALLLFLFPYLIWYFPPLLPYASWNFECHPSFVGAWTPSVLRLANLLLLFFLHWCYYFSFIGVVFVSLNNMVLLLPFLPCENQCFDTKFSSMKGVFFSIIFFKKIQVFIFLFWDFFTSFCVFFYWQRVIFFIHFLFIFVGFS
jgi:hypothetical protein